MNPDELAELEVALAELERERYVDRLKSDLHFFLRECWHVVEPSFPFIDNWHIRLMCRYLEAVEQGELFEDLVINIPPGCCKSLLCSVVYPSWLWARDPSLRIMAIAYAIAATQRDSDKARDLIGSEWYRRYFPHVQIRADKDSSTLFKTTAGGYRLATSPGGRATGEHPHRVICHPAGTLIRTDKGDVPVEKIAKNPGQFLVLTHAFRYMPITASGSRIAGKVIRLVADGRETRITTEHPVWSVSRGSWVRAGDVVEGERLLRLREDVPIQKEGTQVLHLSVHERIKTQGRHAKLHSVREAVLSRARAHGSNSYTVLLQGLQQRGSYKARKRHNLQEVQKGLSRKRWGSAAKAFLQHCLPSERNDKKADRAKMRVVQSLHGPKARIEEAFLQRHLPRHAPCPLHVGKGKQQLPRRTGKVQVSKRVYRDSQANHCARQLLLSALRKARIPVAHGNAGASHRLRPKQQRSEQSAVPLPQVPRKDARSKDAYVVASNLQTHGGRVYSIGVAEDHTYWADGFLVHNCDDPHNVRGANSEVINQSVLDWWDQTIATRGIGVGVRKLIIMQRLGVNDLVGHILFNKENPGLAEGWAHLCLPMRYEPGRMKDIGLGCDPRTIEDELLWPEFLSPKRIAKVERDLGGVFAISCQMQQNPVLKSGNFYELDRIRLIEQDEVPELARYVRAWDKAATEGGGCNTAGVLAGCDANCERVYFLDCIAEKLHVSAVESTIVSVSNIDKARYGDDKYEVVVEEEQGASGKQSIWETTRRLRRFRVFAFKPTTNKPARGQKLSQAMHRYEVYVVIGSWTHKFLEELRQFPKGKLKDRADAANMAYNRLNEPSFLVPYADENEDESADSYYLCENPDCKRPSKSNGDYCCDGCRTAHLSGRVTAASGAFGHSPECNLCTHTAVAVGWRSE